jgi:aminoglycoside phosphotransferase (APT) family kinase protein
MEFSSGFQFAEPLAYDSDLRVMIQGPIRQEKTLEELIVRAIKDRTTEAVDELTDGMLKTARGLAELHQSGLALGREFGWEEDMAEVREVVDRLTVSLPHIGQAARPFVERLSQMESSSQPDPRVSAHGTFRPAQVLIHQGEIGFIDFDSFGQAEPAKDLGLFLCAFMRVGMATVKFDDDDDLEVSTEPLDDAARLARFEWLIALSERFLDEYERSYRPVNRQRVALFQALEIFILILHAWTKVKVRELKDIMYLLQHFLQAHNILKLS